MTRTVCSTMLVCLGLAPTVIAQGIDIWSDPRAEAEYLAVEITGQLSAPVFLADQIQADLAAIRSSYPNLADIRVFPDWVPGELIVGLTPSAFAEFQNGTYTGFDLLYGELGAPTETPSRHSEWVLLEFGQVYHALRLAELFEEASGVRYAEPNSVIGDGDDIEARPDRTYTLSRGYGDCPAGCIFRENYDFTVTDEGVHPSFIHAPEPSTLVCLLWALAVGGLFAPRRRARRLTKAS